MKKLATEMKRYRLANTDLDVSRLSYGTWHLDGTWKSDEVVGRVLKKHPGLRDKLVLQGKAGIILANQPEEGDPGRYDFSYDHIVSTVEGILKRLGTDRLDLLALHRPDPLIEPEELARAIEHLHKI